MANPTLEETLREVIGETSDTPATETKDTDQGKTGADTKSGETASKEYVGGVDISDVPEQDRPRIKELLSKKVQLVERGAQEKFREIAKYKKERDELMAQGITEDEAAGVLRTHIQQKQAPQGKAETLRTLDKMIKESPLEQRESLHNLRQIISEETGASDLKKELDEIKKSLGIVNNERATTRVQSLNNALNALSESYGKDFIDKYRDDIIRQGLVYPGADVKRLMSALADPEDMEQAILSKAIKSQKQKTDKKLAAITGTGSGVTGTSEAVDLKGESHKSLLSKILSGNLK